MEWVLHPIVTTTAVEKNGYHGNRWWCSHCDVNGKQKKILFNLSLPFYYERALSMKIFISFTSTWKYIFTTTFSQSTVLALSTQRGLWLLIGTRFSWSLWLTFTFTSFKLTNNRRNTYDVLDLVLTDLNNMSFDRNNMKKTESTDFLSPPAKL